MKMCIMTRVASTRSKWGNGANETALSAIKVAPRKYCSEVLSKMLCNSEIDRDSRSFRVLYSLLLLVCVTVRLSATLYVPATDYSTTAAILTNNSNSSLDDNLYVIKAVVYEIGILTDADNTTDDTTERQEEVKISFYDPPNRSNGS